MELVEEIVEKIHAQMDIINAQEDQMVLGVCQMMVLHAIHTYVSNLFVNKYHIQHTYSPALKHVKLIAKQQLQILLFPLLIIFATNVKVEHV
jgi:ABC-type uncharacterized transport system permease subunit